MSPLDNKYTQINDQNNLADFLKTIGGDLTRVENGIANGKISTTDARDLIAVIQETFKSNTKGCEKDANVKAMKKEIDKVAKKIGLNDRISTSLADSFFKLIGRK